MPKVIEQAVPTERVVQREVPAPQVQIIDELVDVPVRKQNHVPMVTKAQKAIEAPQVEIVDQNLHIPVHKHRYTPVGTVGRRGVSSGGAGNTGCGAREGVPGNVATDAESGGTDIRAMSDLDASVAALASAVLDIATRLVEFETGLDKMLSRVVGEAVQELAYRVGALERMARTAAPKLYSAHAHS